MATPSPGSLFDQLFDKVGQALQPPAWVVREVQRRVVLTLNHVLQQEPEAQARLKRQSGRVVEAHWRSFSMRLQATPAGLLDLGPPELAPDLTLTITESSPWSLAQATLRGQKPPVRIAGDVQLAAEVQWLVDHVRWDVEEDLARIVGDAPAHTIGQVGRRVADALRQFVGAATAAGGTGRDAAAAAAAAASAAGAAGAASAPGASAATAPGAAGSGFPAAGFGNAGFTGTASPFQAPGTPAAGGFPAAPGTAPAPAAAASGAGATASATPAVTPSPVPGLATPPAVAGDDTAGPGTPGGVQRGPAG